jgi:hypothetical protein
VKAKQNLHDEGSTLGLRLDSPTTNLARAHAKWDMQNQLSGPAVKSVKLKRKNLLDTKGGGDVCSSIVCFGEGVLQTSGDESSSRLSMVGTRAARDVATPTVRGL